MVVAQLVGHAAGARQGLELRGERRIAKKQRFDFRGARGVERAKF